MSGRRNNDEPEQPKRGYRYRPADRAAGVPDEEENDLAAELDDEEDEDELDDEFDEDEESDEDGDEDGDEEEPPSEFWPAAELLKGATITDAELELSYSASVYVNTPAAELRLWLRMPDGTNRLV